MKTAVALVKQAVPHLRNATWSTAEYLFYPLLMLAATPVLVASLGTADFGLLMLVNSVAGMGTAGSLGMGAATIKFVSSAAGRNDRAEAVEVIRTTLGLAVAGTAVVAGLVVLTAPLLARHVFEKMGEHGQVTLALMFAAFNLMVMQIDGVFACGLRGLERFGTAARLEIGFKVAAVVISMAVAWVTRNLDAVLVASGACLAASGLAKGWTLGRFLGQNVLHIDFGNRTMLRTVLGFGWWNWLSGIGSLLFVHADRLLIGALIGANAVGYYAVCTQLAQQVHALPAAAMAFLFPLISRKLQTDDGRALRRVRNYGVAVNVAISLTLGLAMMVFGPLLLALWMGRDFAANSSHILLWLTVAYFVLSLNVAPYYLLLGHDEARYVSVANLAGGGMGILAAVILLPTLGVIGAAQARLVLGLTTLANYWRLYRPKVAP
ncbi:MAG: oligosaccharide flippase family protein [Rhodospirillaceae bacterium]